MRRFRFKLQTVLDQRKAREDRLQAELGELRRLEAEERNRLVLLRSRLRASIVAMEEMLRDSAPAEDLRRFDEYAKALRDDVKVQELTIEAVRTRVEAKRVEVVKAMQDRKVLETLRDKQERACLAEQARAEQIELDDMSSLRYARRA